MKNHYSYVNNRGVMASFAQVPNRMFEKNKAFETHPNFLISCINYQVRSFM
jgi:hypothetical protein